MIIRLPHQIARIRYVNLNSEHAVLTPRLKGILREAVKEYGWDAMKIREKVLPAFSVESLRHSLSQFNVHSLKESSQAGLQKGGKLAYILNKDKPPISLEERILMFKFLKLHNMNPKAPDMFDFSIKANISYSSAYHRCYNLRKKLTMIRYLRERNQSNDGKVLTEEDLCTSVLEGCERLKLNGMSHYGRDWVFASEFSRNIKQLKLPVKGVTATLAMTLLDHKFSDRDILIEAISKHGKDPEAIQSNVFPTKSLRTIEKEIEAEEKSTLLLPYMASELLYSFSKITGFKASLNVGNVAQLFNLPVVLVQLNYVKIRLKWKEMTQEEYKQNLINLLALANQPKLYKDKYKEVIHYKKVDMKTVEGAIGKFALYKKRNKALG